MADKLKELYDEWEKNAGIDPTTYQAFQAGLTAGAVSMRTRAVHVAQTGKDKNDVINGIGQLSDIPA